VFSGHVDGATAESEQLSFVNVHAMHKPSSAHTRAHVAAVCAGIVRYAPPVASAGVAATQRKPKAREVKTPRMGGTLHEEG